LKIGAIDTIQITETSLHSRWVTVFRGEEHKKDRLRSEEFLENHLQPYYNLISIWEYLRKTESRPRTHTNVMTDDFSGKISPAWMQVGKMSDELIVVPKGDKTYPLLSMADLLMELVKQEVDDWNEKHIYEYLAEATPGDSAYVDSDSISEDRELRMIAPMNSNNINTHLYYPHPVIYIDVGGSIDSRTVSSLDFFHHATRFARENGGCVKFFSHNQDRDYVTSDDYLVTIGGNESRYAHLSGLNSDRSPEVLSTDEAKTLFDDEFGAYSE
jgi:hypothetical protein